MKLALIGLLAGFMSALFGVGGGIVVVPLLLLLVAYTPHVATATSLAAIGITALAGTITFAIAGEVESATRCSSACPRPQARPSARRSSSAFARRELSYLFAAFLARDRRVAPRMTFALAVLLGFAAGIVAGMFGVAVGSSSCPRLIALGLGQVEAQATSLAAILPTVAAGTWRQASYGNVRWKPALVIGLTSVVGVLGERRSRSRCRRHAQRLFAVFLIAVAAQVAWRARTDRPSFRP